MREGKFHSQHGYYYVLHINSAEKSWSSRMSFYSLKWQALAWLPSFQVLQLILSWFLSEEVYDELNPVRHWVPSKVSMLALKANIPVQSIQSSTYFTFSFIFIIFSIFSRIVGQDLSSWKITSNNSSRAVNSSAQEHPRLDSFLNLPLQFSSNCPLCPEPSILLVSDQHMSWCNGLP